MLFFFCLGGGHAPVQTAKNKRARAQTAKTRPKSSKDKEDQTTNKYSYPNCNVEAQLLFH